MKVGIIGGTGLDHMDILKEKHESHPTTPFGKPSSPLTTGTIDGVNVVLLARHGRSHEFSPTDVNYRANIQAVKAAGCTHILATTACGSLKKNIHPGDLVVLDQFIDQTVRRPATLYPDKVLHLPMADPFCQILRETLKRSAKALRFRFHPTGTVVTIEGPRFSTRAESHLFRSWGADVINMSTVPEVVLAREAGICYAAVALATDYDCWKEDAVDIQKVLATMKANSENVIRLFLHALPAIQEVPCQCREDIKNAGI